MTVLIDKTLHDAAATGSKIELWGGHECTVNRVQDAWFDQTIRAGHEDRLEDLTLFAGLGLRKLRYPVLWERVSPRTPDERDFTWTDARLDEIRRLDMAPIATLCHHGSGPQYTSLLEDSFADGLARHAAAVAERYPWIADYTPVNEPLTTARFSALYGFWYPHLRDEGAFWLALLNETDATRLSMRAIRRVNPAARLIQTDDLGFCHATPPLQHDADFQNERRWMGWDLLCGKVTPEHPLWHRLARFGLGDRMRRIADDPCPPDVIGIDHYLSSERLLDHRIALHGGRGMADRDLGSCNGILHVDVDAVRCRPDDAIGLTGLVRQAWDRYGLPIAVTECHYSATREEQARWFIAAWDEMTALRHRGVDVRAVTAWSLLGSYDWNRMVTTTAGHYEPGVFDVREGCLRPTLMVRVLQDLASGRRPQGPGLDVPGSWRGERDAGSNDDHAPLAILRGDDALTEGIAQACDVRRLNYCIIDGDDRDTLATARPWAVFDARIDADELAWLDHCRDAGISGVALVGPSADSATVDHILAATIPSLFFAHDDMFEAETLDALDEGDVAVADGRRDWYAAYAPSVIDGVLDLLLDGTTGVVHFLPEPGWTRTDVARTLATVAGHEPCRVVDKGGAGPCCQAEPPVTSYLPCLETMLERFVHDRRRHRNITVVVGNVVLEAAE